MKKLALFIVLTLVLSLCACSISINQHKEEPTEESTTELPLSDFELCAEFAVSQIRDLLKNPNSLVINHLYGVESDEEGYYFSIDYSGENGFGGMNRDTFYIHITKSGNGFGIRKYGSSNVADETNQQLTASFYNKIALNGYFEFDPITYRITTAWE